MYLIMSARWSLSTSLKSHTHECRRQRASRRDGYFGCPTRVSILIYERKRQALQRHEQVDLVVECLDARQDGHSQASRSRDGGEEPCAHVVL